MDPSVWDSLLPLPFIFLYKKVFSSLLWFKKKSLYLLDTEVIGGRLAGFIVRRWTCFSSERTFSNLLLMAWNAVLGLAAAGGGFPDLQDPSETQPCWGRNLLWCQVWAWPMESYLITVHSLPLRQGGPRLHLASFVTTTTEYIGIIMETSPPLFTYEYQHDDQHHYN